MANTYTQIYIKTDEERGSVNVPPRTGLELFLVLVSTKMALLTELGAVKEYGRMRNDGRFLVSTISALIRRRA